MRRRRLRWHGHVEWKDDAYWIKSCLKVGGVEDCSCWQARKTCIKWEWTLATSGTVWKATNPQCHVSCSYLIQRYLLTCVDNGRPNLSQLPSTRSHILLLNKRTHVAISRVFNKSTPSSILYSLNDINIQ